MKHHLQISVSKKPKNTGIIACSNMCIRERFLRFLLGSPQKLTIIVPGDTVEELAIKELERGGNQDVKGESTCRADRGA